MLRKKTRAFPVEHLLCLHKKREAIKMAADYMQISIHFLPTNYRVNLNRDKVTQ